MADAIASPAAPAASTTNTTSTTAPVASVAPKATQPTPTPTGRNTSVDASKITTPQGTAGLVDPEPVEGEAATPAPETAAQKAARKIKYKVRGKESEVDIASMSDEDLATKLQLADAGRLSMQEAADVRKQFAGFFEQFTKDPLSITKNPELAKFMKDFDLEKWAENHLAQKYSEELLSEDQRENLRIKRENEAYKKREAEEQETRTKQAQIAYDQQVQQDLERDIIGALDTQKLPNNRATVAIMADIMRSNLEHDLELTHEQIATETNKRLRETNKHVLSGLKGDALADYLGPDVVREIVNLSVQKVRATRSTNAVTPPPAKPTVRPDARPSAAERGESRIRTPRPDKFWRNDDL